MSSDGRTRAESEASGDGGLPRARALDAPPPVLRRWDQLYWLVGGLLAADVLVFWLLTRWAA